MRIQNIGIFAKEDAVPFYLGRTSQQKKSGNSIFAGDMNQGQNNSIHSKKKQLYKNAMQAVVNTAASEGEIDAGLDARRSRIKELQDSSKQANDEINKINDMINQSREAHGVTEDSQEQKDLEILLKQRSGESLSKEEENRLNEMGDLTAYQREALAYESQKGEYRRQIEMNQSEIGSESTSIRATKLARLASHAMVDAQKNKDVMMDAASKEIVGMLSQEAMQHIAQEQQKAMEEAQKRAEKQEEQEKKLEEAKLEREEAELKLDIERHEGKEETPIENIAAEQMPQNMEQTQNSDIMREQIEAELKKVMQEEKLLAEELKGLAVDALG